MMRMMMILEDDIIEVEGIAATIKVPNTVLRQRNLRTTVIGEITNHHLETIGMENENANTAQVQANTTSLPKNTDVKVVISWPLLYLCKQTKLFNCLSTFVLRN